MTILSLSPSHTTRDPFTPECPSATLTASAPARGSNNLNFRSRQVCTSAKSDQGDITHRSQLRSDRVPGKALDRISMPFQGDLRGVLSVLDIPKSDEVITRSRSEDVGSRGVEIDLSYFPVTMSLELRRAKRNSPSSSVELGSWGQIL